MDPRHDCVTNRIVQTKRLLLRPYTTEDLEEVDAFSSDEATMKYLLQSDVRNLEETKYFIQSCIDKTSSSTMYYFAAEELQTGAVIGSVALQVTDRTEGDASIEYVFNRNFWGRGYATEVVKSLVRYGKQRTSS